MSLAACRYQAPTPAAFECEAVTAVIAVDVVAIWAGVVIGAGAYTVYAAAAAGERSKLSVCVGSIHTRCSSGTDCRRLPLPQSKDLTTAVAAKARPYTRLGSRL